MKTHKNLYKEIHSIKNLFEAYKKARIGKTKKDYVIKFKENLRDNLNQLHIELVNQTYSPRPLKTFILRDPKTRVISKSHFRDRIIHHALFKIIEPIFEKTFIFDCCANRIGKGTTFALRRFNDFKRKTSANNTKTTYILKADIRHYFQEVNHEILKRIIGKKIADKDTMWLIGRILDNNVKRSADSGGGGRTNLECLWETLPASSLLMSTYQN